MPQRLPERPGSAEHRRLRVPPGTLARLHQGRRGRGPSGASVYLDNSHLACTIDYASPCRACEPDDICFNETLLHCPQHSSSPRGSDDDRDCVCDPGYAGLYGAENDA